MVTIKGFIKPITARLLQLTVVIAQLVTVKTASYMLPDYQNITMANLVDLLSQETKKFTQLMMEKKRDKDYEESKTRIQQLQAAIADKKAQHTGQEPNI